MKITFLGASHEVTGSRYLIEYEGTKILVDCGLFQGSKEDRARNWDPFPVEPSSISAIFLTHAHIDHTGYIPLLVKNGFAGTVYCSKATAALCALLLVDSGALQEEDAQKANDYGYSSHHPALPLYTEADAQHSLKFFHGTDYDKVTTIGSLHVTLIRSGHILGSSFVVVSDGKKTLTFSGDLGRPHPLVMKAPPHLTQTDFLVIESTYGDRLHDEVDPIQALGVVIRETVKKGGVLIIPAFAVGRTQTILYCLYELKQQNAIPNIPIYLDSPMAINVTDLFCQFNNEHTLPTNSCSTIFSVATYTRTVEQSKRIDHHEGAAIIIAASGMATGGRVLDHLKHRISDPRNTVLFVGYQAEGTLGRQLVDGASQVTIHEKNCPVRAEIKTLHNLSGHADYTETLEWLSYFKNSPKKVFVTHGELPAAQSLQKKIEERFGWSVVIPQYLESFDLE